MNDIPIYEPYLVGNEKKYVLDCLDTNWISSRGDYVQRFEKAFSDNLNASCIQKVSPFWFSDSSE